MMTTKDRKLLDDNNIQVYAPELKPRKGVKSLFFPLPPGLMFQADNRLPLMNNSDLTYVGNVYGRYKEAKEYFTKLSQKGYNVNVFGNWLESGSDRPGAKIVTEEMPLVKFRGRCLPHTVIEQLAVANSTIHLHKPSYAPVGFLTMRWAEAAMAFTPAFVPSDFWLPLKQRKQFKPMIVKDGDDLVYKYEELFEEEWLAIAYAQRNFIFEKFSLQKWIDLIEKG